MNWSSPLRSFDGTPATDENGATITLGQLAIRALLTTPRDALDGDEKFRRYKAAEKIHAGQHLTIDELAKVKQVCGEALMPLAVGAIWSAIESTPHA